LSYALLSRGIDEAQKLVESYYYGIRKDLFKYDEVMENQRQVLYNLRRTALADTDESIAACLRDFNDQNVDELLSTHIQADQPVQSWGLEQLAQDLTTRFMGTWSVEAVQLEALATGQGNSSDGGAAPAAGLPGIRHFVRQKTHEAIGMKERAIDMDGPCLQHSVKRQILLMLVDTFWQRHLEHMDSLRDAVKLRAYGEQDPVVEYKRDAYKAFAHMMVRIRRNVVFYLFNFQPRPLVHVTRQRVAVLIGDAPVVTKAHARSEDLVMEVQQQLQQKGTEVRGGKVVLPFACVAGTLAQAGLWSREEQVQWVAAIEGLELLEDEFAKELYVSLHRCS